MKSPWLFMLLSLAAGRGLAQESVMQLNILSYNLRVPAPDDGENHWQYRKDAAAKLFTVEDVDIAGLQEADVAQLQDLMARLPGYTNIGYGGGSLDGLECPIVYKTSRFTRIASGTFWLSETPEVYASTSWDSTYPRTAVWAVFEEKSSGGRFFFINTHLDHRGPEARDEGTKLILKEMARLRGGLDAVLTGDFNAEYKSQPVKNILNKRDPNRLVYAKEAAHTTGGTDYTVSDYGKREMSKRNTIDFIFVNDSVEVLSYEVLPETLDGVYLSDHIPVKTVIRLPVKNGKE